MTDRRVIFRHNSSNIFALQIFVKAGSAYEKEGERGWSHLLEHMMFKSKRDKSVETLLLQLNELGGVFNALTNKDYTSFYIRTTEDRWKDSCDILKKVVMEPYFLKEELEKEKQVVVEEFLQYEDDVQDVLFSQAYERFLSGKNPYRHPVKGNLDDIQRARPDTLTDYYMAHYRDIMIYVSCGRKHSKRIQSYVRSIFESPAKAKATETRPTESRLGHTQELTSPKGPVVRIVREGKRSQNATVIMFQGFPHSDKRNVVLSLLWDILAGSLNSLLMMEMRENKGLVYRISSFNDSYLTTGLTGIYFTSSTHDLVTIMSYITRIFKRLAKKGLSPNILRYSKSSYTNKLQYKLTQFDFRCEREMMRAYYGCAWDEDYVARKVKRITNDQIKKISKRVFDFDRCCVISIGNYKDPQKLERSVVDLLQE
jgi:predicted Zn-dependent peptidase